MNMDQIMCKRNMSKEEYFLWNNHGFSGDDLDNMVKKMADVYLHPTKGWKGNQRAIMYKKDFLANENN